MNKYYVILSVVLALVVGGTAGYYGAGYKYGAQIEKAKKAFPTMPSMQSVYGTVKSVSGNTLTVQTPPSANPFEDLPTVRTVTVTSTTKIEKSEQRDPKIFQEEMTAYQTAMQKIKPGQALEDTPIPPMMFVQKSISLSDIKEGDMVSVDAGKDVKTATSFEAVGVVVTSLPAGVGTLPPVSPAVGAASIVPTASAVVPVAPAPIAPKP